MEIHGRITNQRKMKTGILLCVLALGVGVAFFTPILGRNQQAWAAGDPCTLTIAVGQSSSGPDELSAKHPAITVNLTGGVTFLNPQEECKSETEKWEWSIKDVKLAKWADGKLGEAKVITNPGISVTSGSSSAVLTVKEKVLNQLGKWTATVELHHYCVTNKGNTCDETKTVEVVWNAFEVVLAVHEIDKKTNLDKKDDDNYVLLRDDVGVITGRDKDGELLTPEKHLFTEPCFARIEGKTAADVKVTLTGTLVQFPEKDTDGMLVEKEKKDLALSADGAWVPFDISGHGQVEGKRLIGSKKKDDALIVASVDQIKATSKDLTVFWFDGKVEITPVGYYRIDDVGTKGTMIGIRVPENEKPAVKMSVWAILNPLGAAEKAPQIKEWKEVALVQNFIFGATTLQMVYVPDSLKLKAGVPSGTKYTFLKSVDATLTYSPKQVPALDTDKDKPTILYDKSASSKISLSPDKLNKATSTDSPDYFNIKTFVFSVTSSSGEEIGTENMRVEGAKINRLFSTWCTVTNGSTYIPVSQKNWSIHTPSMLLNKSYVDNDDYRASSGTDIIPPGSPMIDLKSVANNQKPASQTYENKVPSDTLTVP